eukprot:Partr_v1_DN27264_c0_g2_i1_m38418
MNKLASIRKKIVSGCLGINTSLKTVTIQLEFILKLWQDIPTGHLQLPLHQISAGNHFSDGMLHLQARIHFHEVKLTRLTVHDELDGASADVLDSLSSRHRLLTQITTQLLGQVRSGRLLDHLLMTPLHTAVTLKQVDGITVRITKHLHLHMPRRNQILFNQHTIITKRLARLTLGRLEHDVEIIGRLDDTHSLATTTLDSLDQHRIADLCRLSLEKLGILIIAVISRHNRNTSLTHDTLGGTLGTHGTNSAGRRTNKDQPLTLNLLGKLGILRQEAVARMNGPRTTRLCHLQYLVHQQIGLTRRRRTDTISLIGHGDVHRL